MRSRYLEETDTPPRRGLRPAHAGHGRPGLPQRGARASARPRASFWSPAYGSIESAVEAMRVGADDYLTKPVDLYELRQRVHEPAREAAAQGGGLELCASSSTSATASRASSAARRRWRRLFEQMKLVAPTRSSVLIIGESGTGKELVANAASPREPAAQRALPGDQLRRHPARHPRERALRPRARRFHRRHRRARSASSSWPTAARCSSTRSASSTPSCR